MGCGDEKLSKYLTQTFTAHCNAMICQQVTLSDDAEWPKVADAVIEAGGLIAEIGCGNDMHEHIVADFDKVAKPYRWLWCPGGDLQRPLRGGQRRHCQHEHTHQGYRYQPSHGFVLYQP